MDKAYLRAFLSGTARDATRSDIRELLKLIARPEVISLAGGLPSPDTFPIEELSELIPAALNNYGAAALQYGLTEGDPDLRAEIAKLMAADGVPDVGLDRISITTASQQGLDMCGRVFIDPGDTVVCGLPSYLGALGAFSAYGARFCGIPLDDEGIRTDVLEEKLVDLRRGDVRPKLLYVVPDFQNPAGVTLSLPRRTELLAIAEEFDLLVVEDSPYRQLRYVGSDLPSLLSLDRQGRVISLYTFSKILFPGIRLGWAIADRSVISRFVTVKQSMDLCTGSFTQVVAREFLKTGVLGELVERTRACYGERREAMLGALERMIDPDWGVRWTRPEGGMFLWVTLPPWMKARRLLERSLQEHVAFVCGSAFHCDGSGESTLRLNFSFPDVEQIQAGIRRLSRAMEDLVEQRGDVDPRDLHGVEMEKPPLVSGRHCLEQLSLNLALTETVV